MTTPAHNVAYSYADYLALEASGTTKHEYLAGQIYGMAGGTPAHAALAAAVTGLLFGQLRGAVSTTRTCACAFPQRGSRRTPT